MTEPSPTPTEQPTETPTAPGGDSAFWAKAVSRLSVGAMPQDAINRNVQGRALTGPVQGFGRMWRKTHRVRLADANLTPPQVVAIWKEHFGEFWPRGNRFYRPLTGLTPGEVALLNVSLGGGAKLSTGVLVLYADDESFALMTPQGHMLAGLITFSAYDDGGTTVAQAEIVMRASDPLYEIGMVLFGHRRENRFWEATLASLAAHLGVTAVAQTEVECVDPGYQWSRAGNVWQNAAIRTGIYQATSPVVRIARDLRRRAGS